MDNQPRAQNPEALGPKEQKSYDQMLLDTVEERDARTESLVSELSTLSARDFVIKACEAAGIKPPKKTEKLAPKVIAIQRKLGFPEQDFPLGIDGKLGNYTFKKLLLRYEQLKQYDKRREEIIASTKAKKEELNQKVLSRNQTQLTPPAPISAESKEHTPVTAKDVVLIGDSLTYGYRRYFNINGEKVPTATDKKYVKSGKSVLRMLKDFNKLNAEGKLDNVKVIVLFGGANDLSYRSSSEIIGYLEAMRQVMLNKKPPAKVVLVTLPPVQGYMPFGRKRALCEKRVKEINTWIRNQAGGNTQVVDLYQKIADENRDGYMQRKYNGGDGLHLSRKGYKELADAVQKAVV